jgi:hypothetical protein
MLSRRQKLIKSLTLPLAMLVFVALFAVDLFLVPLAGSSQIQRDQKIIVSERINDPEDKSLSKDLAPRIDPEAATIVREVKTGPVCATLPGELWILLLAAYIFLLFFNLFYDFEQSIKIHWFWESLYALLALIGWYAWDGCHQNIWFPLYVLKLGIIVYLVYLYLFYKKKELQPLTDEDLENFEG